MNQRGVVNNKSSLAEKEGGNEVLSDPLHLKRVLGHQDGGLVRVWAVMGGQNVYDRNAKVAWLSVLVTAHVHRLARVLKHSASSCPENSYITMAIEFSPSTRSCIARNNRSPSAE